MADPANLETLQAQREQETQQLYRRNALRHALSVLDPQPGDVALDYGALLTRLQDVITAALAAQHPEAAQPQEEATDA
jgi:predicted component of type VI protein secretion system